MAPQPIPDEFRRLASHFHQDVLLIHGSLEAAMADAISSLGAKEQDVVSHYIDHLLSGAPGERSPQGAWRQVQRDIVIRKERDLVALLRLAQSLIQAAK